MTSVSVGRNLTEEGHNNMDKFLSRILNAHKSGRIETLSAIGDIMHVVTALDNHNITEVRSYISLTDDQLFEG